MNGGDPGNNEQWRTHTGPPVGGMWELASSGYGRRFLGLPAPVAFELYYRAFKSRRQDASVSRLDGMAFEIGPFEASDARAARAVRADLERSGRPIGPYDLLIAGQARARRLVRATANVRQFARMDGLACEDWSRPPPGACGSVGRRAKEQRHAGSDHRPPIPPPQGDKVRVAYLGQSSCRLTNALEERIPWCHHGPHGGSRVRVA